MMKWNNEHEHEDEARGPFRIPAVRAVEFRLTQLAFRDKLFIVSPAELFLS